MATVSGLAQATWDRLTTLQVFLNVFDGHAPTGAGETYVVFYPQAGGAFSTRQGGTFDSLGWGFYLTVAGRTRLQVLRGVDLARNCLLAFSPDPSPAAGYVEEVETGATIQQDKTGLFSLALRYTLTTNRS